MNLKLLKNKNLSLLIIGQFVSQFGSGMQGFAFSLYILHLTGSGVMFASVLAIGTLPRLILGPICGVFADWFDRKKIIVYLDLISAVLIGALFIISLRTELNIGHIYFAVIVMSIISALFSPAISAAIPSLVPKKDLVGANALNRLALTLCYMFYPIAAGFIFGLWGISVVLLLNAISFLLSSVSEMFIDLASPNKIRKKPSYDDFKRDFKAGIQVILDHKLIRSIMILSIMANALIAPAISVGLIFVANQRLEISDWQLGMLQTALVSGSLFGTLLTSALSKGIKLEKLLSLAVMVIGLLILAIGVNASGLYLNLFETNLLPYISLMFIAVSITTVAVITNIGVATMMQKEVPLDLFGRVSSVKETFSMAAVPLGQLAFGIIFDYTRPWIPFLICGLLVVLLGLSFSSNTRPMSKSLAATSKL